MRNKIVRADGETIITEFKSFRYVEQVNDESNLRYGAVISSFIEAEVFGSPSSAIQEGEVLTYYQVFDTDNEFNQLPDGQSNEIKIGIFTANVTTPGKNIYKFTAYDNISKLDTDFSAIMKANPNSFPMSVSSVVNLISSETGLTFNLSQCPLINLGNLVSVFYFYSNGITCRQVLSYIAEVSSCNIYCLPNGTIYAQPYISNRSETIPPPDFYWKDNYHYIICPTDQVQYIGTDSVGNPITLIPVFYKEDGFKKADYTCDSLDTFSVRKTDGTVVWSMEGSNTENIYEINTNPIIDYLMLDESIDWDDIMDNVEAPIESETLKGIVPFTIQLFPFRNPFRAGEFVPYIQGSDGVRFRSLIMKMEVTEREAVLYCYGDEKWHVSSQINRTADEMNTALSAQINAVDIIRFGDQPDHNYFTIGSFKNLKDYDDNIVIYYGNENSVFIQACEYWWQFDSLGNTSLPKPLTIYNGGTGARNASDALTALGAAAKSSVNSAHIYFSPSELGLSGTPTIKAITDTMPNHSIGCFDSNTIDQTALTHPFGDPVNVVVIFKYGQYRTFAVGARAYNNVSDTAARYAFASYNGSAWKGWYAIVKEQELRYQTNDTYVSTKSHLLYGIITGGSTNFVCDVVLPKTLENITGVTVTAMTGIIRGVLGNVDNPSQNVNLLASPYSATAEKLDYNKIRITVHKSSAYTNTTNNSPATYWGSISLKFT